MTMSGGNTPEQVLTVVSLYSQRELILFNIYEIVRQSHQVRSLCNKIRHHYELSTRLKAEVEVSARVQSRQMFSYIVVYYSGQVSLFRFNNSGLPRPNFIPDPPPVSLSIPLIRRPPRWPRSRHNLHIRYRLLHLHQ